MVRQFFRYLLATFIVAPLFSCSPALAQLGPGGGSSFNQANVRITGGTIDNTTIGSSTPTSVIATTVTATSFISAGSLNMAGSGNIATVTVNNINAAAFTSQIFGLPSTYRFSWTSSSNPSGTEDLTLVRDAAGTLAQRNGTNAQAFRIYNTFTDASNYERAYMRWVTGFLQIGTENAGTGSARPVLINAGTILYFDTASIDRWIIDNVSLRPAADLTYPLGDSTHRITTVNTNYVQSGVLTVGTLTACAAGTKGLKTTVSDATQTFASANFGVAVTGGGANFVPVICDGTSWKIGG